MNRLFWIVLVAGAALSGCQRHEATASPAAQRESQAVAAATPASDPSLPSAAEVAAAASAPASDATH